MLKYIFSLVLTAGIIQLNAQNCNEGQHAANANDGWVSCEITAAPNPARGDAHWIMYDLGYVYAIGTTHFWNYNVIGETSKGMKNITIDYSLDGINWTEATSFQLSEASGMDNYEGEAGPDLGDVPARYILISSVDTWGSGDCAGLSEVRFDIGEVVGIPEVTPDGFTLELFPNPATEQLRVNTNLEVKEVIILNTSGHEVFRTTQSNRLDIKSLPPGVYVLKCTGSNYEILTKRFIKQ